MRGFVVSHVRLRIAAAFAGVGLIGLLVALAVDFALDRPGLPPAIGADAHRSAPAAAPRASTTLREAAERIARRHGVGLVVHDGVRLDAPAPAVPDGDLEAPALESTLRGLLAGNELLFHYGTDQGQVGSRLKAVWVFPNADVFAVRPAGTAGDGVTAVGEAGDGQRPAAAPQGPAGAAAARPVAAANRGLQDPDEGVRLEALHAALAAASPPDLGALRRIVETDASEAVRIQALDAYVSHPDASDDEVRALLDRIGVHALQMLAEHARALREARAAAPADIAQSPEPIEAPR